MSKQDPELREALRFILETQIETMRFARRMAMPSMDKENSELFLRQQEAERLLKKIQPPPEPDFSEMFTEDRAPRVAPDWRHRDIKR